MPHVEIPQAEIKVVILGDSHIGKTSLVTRFSEGYYRENSRPATVGAFFVTKRITVTTYQNTPAKIQIWDTAGQDNFRAMAPMFYKDAAAVIVCYDVTSRESFEGMRRWLEEVRKKKKRKGMEDREDDMIVAIAALKTDLLQEGSSSSSNSSSKKKKKKRMVPEYEVEQLAEALGVMYLPTSAKTNRNVNALFQCVADRVLQMRSTTNSIGSSDTNNNNSNNNIGATDDNNTTSTTMGGGSNNNHHHHDIDTNYPNHTNDTNAQGGDDTLQMASPRRFDKYYVSQNKDETNDRHHHPNHSDNNDNNSNAQTTSKETTIRPHESQSSSRRKSSSHQNNNNGGASTPNTEEGTTTEEDSHPLLLNEKKNRKEKEVGEEHKGGYCQAVSCGAVDGDSGCVVQ